MKLIMDVLVSIVIKLTVTLSTPTAQNPCWIYIITELRKSNKHMYLNVVFCVFR